MSIASISYTCKRCGYDTKQKCHLVRHLKTKKICQPTLEDIERGELLKELEKKYNEITYDCEFCKKRFNSASNRSKHKQTCKKRYNIVPAQMSSPHQTQTYTVLVQQNDVYELKLHISNLQTQILNIQKNLCLELQFYKNRKHEKFYQKLVEHCLCGTHKKLSCGETDITTDDCHVEIKHWPQWKESVGQLTCYNKVDPKPRLAIYMFGKYKDTCKNQAATIIKSCGFELYEFKESEDCEVYIEDFFSKQKVFSYKPDSLMY
jgi:hypothetical protein